MENLTQSIHDMCMPPFWRHRFGDGTNGHRDK